MFPSLYGIVSQGSSTPWYLAGGAPTPVVAYQPLGAASLAASYVNLVNPGTYDAAPGVAPTFSALTGWGFNGTTQYLTTGIVPTGSYTMLARFTDGATKADEIVMGTWAGNANSSSFCIFTKTGGFCYYVNYVIKSAAIVNATGVVALAGKSGYYNGSLVATVGAGVVSTARDIYIGGANGGGSMTLGFPGNVQLIAIYPSSTDHATWVPAVSAAAAALT